MFSRWVPDRVSGEGSLNEQNHLQEGVQSHLRETVWDDGLSLPPTACPVRRAPGSTGQLWTLLFQNFTGLAYVFFYFFT